LLQVLEKKRLDVLYRLLGNAEKEKDEEATAALRWAIFELEKMLEILPF
jgi:hypothetical protein